MLDSLMPTSEQFESTQVEVSLDGTGMQSILVLSEQTEVQCVVAVPVFFAAGHIMNGKMARNPWARTNNYQSETKSMRQQQLEQQQEDDDSPYIHSNSNYKNTNNRRNIKNSNNNKHKSHSSFRSKASYAGMAPLPICSSESREEESEFRCPHPPTGPSLCRKADWMRPLSPIKDHRSSCLGDRRDRQRESVSLPPLRKRLDTEDSSNYSLSSVWQRRCKRDTSCPPVVASFQNQPRAITKQQASTKPNLVLQTSKRSQLLQRMTRRKVIPTLSIIPSVGSQ